MKKPIEIRGHHLICIPRYYGGGSAGGYGNVFALNMKNVIKYIRKYPNTKIKLTVKPDVLCRKCSYLVKNYCTQTKTMNAWTVFEDKKAVKYLKLKPNKIYTAKDAFNLSMEKINKKTFSKVCKGCIYEHDCAKIGINNSFAKDLNRN